MSNSAPTAAAPTQAAQAQGGAASPHSVQDWLLAVLAARGPDRGGALWSALQQRHAAVAAAPELAVFIHLCPATDWQQQLDQLAQRLALPLDDTALLQRFPLLGVPFAVKDNIDIGGQPTTAACPAFAHVAAQSATVVHRLLEAGALWLGKTNLDQFATGLVGTRSPYGRPASVADSTRISGGSSSGSAVAVARGWAAFSLGTDTAGSGRIPAGFNGLVGLKPTPGRVSTAGVLPACRTLDCVSIFAHQVADAAHVLAVIEGPDAKDDYSRFSPGPAPSGQPLRLGVPQSAVLDSLLGYPAAWQAALDQARAHGHTLVDLDFSALDRVAALLYEGPWVAERHSVVQTLLAQQPEALDASVRSVVRRALDMNATQTFEAQYRLRQAQNQLAALWQEVDVLLVPTAPTHPRFAEVDADPLGANAQLGRYTNFVNLLGWCALAVPAGLTAQGLPFGVTFIGPAQHDAVLADVGQRWMAAADHTATHSASAGPSTAVSAATSAGASAATSVAAPTATATTVSLRQPATQATLILAVVGAHLQGLPLNTQLTERGARFLHATHTAAAYRLYALPGTTPPKPGLLRVAEGGVAIAIELWAMPLTEVGSFLALIPPPLGLGTLRLADGSQAHGFLCESHALAGAKDISSFGGWRAYLAAQLVKTAQTPTAALPAR